MHNASLFNDKSDLYASARPHYPQDLFDYIASLSNQHAQAWDCATGNGQAVVGLTKHFRHIEASDISQGQITNAFAQANIHFSVQAAEKTTFKTHQFDLVNVAQALHWFDLERFWPEVQRVLKPKGLFVASTYAWTSVTAKIDELIETELKNIIEPYWAANNRLCWDGYQSLDFPFTKLETPQFKLESHWDLRQYIDFLHTWSATRRCMDDIGDGFFNNCKEKLQQQWGDPKQKRVVTAPLSVIAGYFA